MGRLHDYSRNVEVFRIGKSLVDPSFNYSSIQYGARVLHLHDFLDSSFEGHSISLFIFTEAFGPIICKSCMFHCSLFIVEGVSPVIVHSRLCW